jgi:nucleoid-associated protein YgaU
MRLLRLVCPDPKVDIRVQMGDGPATPTAGYAGWEVTARAGGRRGVTTRTSPPPFQQDVPIFLNGLGKDNSIQGQLDAILSLGAEDAAPFKVWGPIHRGDGRLWVFGGEPEFGEAIRDDDEENTLLRQRLTIKLMQYVRPEVARERKRRRRNRGVGAIGGAVAVGGTYTTRAGDTLQSIAANLFGDWRRWREIGNKNGLTDPGRKLPAGKVLKL